MFEKRGLQWSKGRMRLMSDHDLAQKVESGVVNLWHSMYESIDLQVCPKARA